MAAISDEPFPAGWSGRGSGRTERSPAPRNHRRIGMCSPRNIFRSEVGADRAMRRANRLNHRPTEAINLYERDKRESPNTDWMLACQTARRRDSTHGRYLATEPEPLESSAAGDEQRRLNKIGQRTDELVRAPSCCVFAGQS